MFKSSQWGFDFSLFFFAFFKIKNTATPITKSPPITMAAIIPPFAAEFENTPWDCWEESLISNEINICKV